MISFKQFLNEVSTSKRQGILHLHQMDNVEFVLWLRNVKSQMGMLKDIKCVSKIDGLGMRFGKDRSGNIFFEGSRTGPVFDIGSFSAFARNKTDDVTVISRAQHYDDILSVFKKSKFMSAIDNDVKVIAELFYNPMAEDFGSTLKFVTIKYDKTKLGKLMTICPYSVIKAESGDPHPDSSSIIEKLIKLSDDQIKIVNPDLRFTSIDISGTISPLDIIDDRCLTVIKSRKAADQIEKQNLISVIQKVKGDLTDYLLNHPGIEDKFKFGDDIEGIVLHLPQSSGVKPFKITTKEFQTAHAAQKGEKK